MSQSGHTLTTLPWGMSTKQTNPLQPILKSLGTALAPPKSGQATRKSRSNNRQGTGAKQTMTRTSAPAAYGTAIKSNGRKAPPNIVTHKECVAQIMGTSAFTVNTLAINPGLSSTFPWLSIEANGYNYYRFRSFQIRYDPRQHDGQGHSVHCLGSQS